MPAAGYGLIETMRVRGGRIPFLDRHLARLERSLAELRLPQPVGNLRRLIAPFADADEAALRLETRDGRASITVRALPALDPPAVIVASERHRPYPHKTTDRDPFDEALEEAEVAEADDALLLTPDRWVAEGTTWSLFWWHGGTLRTAALDLGILPGIGRARVLELAPAGEGRYPLDDLRGKSAFLTNAVRGVVPLQSLDGDPVPPDERTADLATRFWPSEG